MDLEQDSYWGSGLQPTNEKIIHCLKKKRLDPAFIHYAVEEINVYDYDPWDLPWKPKIKPKEQVRFFFNKPYYKYAKSKRQHRKTTAGSWKVTCRGYDIKAKDSNEVIGGKTILVFYRDGPNRRQAKTEWVMHQFYVKDNPEFKEDFVVCRIERRRNNKHAISTYDEGQSSQHSASSSGVHVKENIFPESIPLVAPSQHLVSNSNHVAEISETQLSSSDTLISYSGNHVAEVAFPESQLLPNHNLISSINHIVENASLEAPLLPNHSLISYSENHSVENTSPQPQLLPDDNLIFQKDFFLDSQLLSGGHFISYSRNHVSETSSPESQLLPNQDMISYSRNHVTDFSCSESQLPPNHNMISYSRNQIVENSFPESQLIPNHNMSSCSQNHIADKILSEFQPLPNHDLVSYFKYHFPQNASPESQLIQNHDLISYSSNYVADNTSTNPQPLPYHNLISYSSDYVADNTSTNPQLLLNNNLISYYGNHIVEATSTYSQLLPNPDLESQANQHLVSNILPNPYLESQTLPDQHLVSQLQLNPDLKSQLLPNQHLFSYSINDALERTFQAELPALAKSNAGNSYNGLDNESFSALQSPIYPENGSSYSSVSSNDCNLLNSKFGIEQVEGLVSSQWAFQEDYFSEGTGQTLTPDFNSSKPDGGVYVDDSCNQIL